MKHRFTRAAAVFWAAILFSCWTPGCEEETATPDGSAAPGTAPGLADAANAGGPALTEAVKKDLVGTWLAPGGFGNDVLVFQADGTGENIMEDGERTPFRYHSDERGKVVISDPEGMQPDTYLYLTHRDELLLGLDPLRAEWIRARRTPLLGMNMAATQEQPIELGKELFVSSDATGLNEFMESGDGPDGSWSEAEQLKAMHGVWLLVREWSGPGEDRPFYDGVLVVRDDGACRMVIQRGNQRAAGELRLEKDPHAPRLQLVDVQTNRVGMYVITNGRLSYFHVAQQGGKGALGLMVSLSPDEAVERYLSR